MSKESSVVNRAALSVKEVCERFNISKGQVFILLKTNQIQRIKMGRRTLIPVESADAWWASIGGPDIESPALVSRPVAQGEPTTDKRQLDRIEQKLDRLLAVFSKV